MILEGRFASSASKKPMCVIALVALLLLPSFLRADAIRKLISSKFNREMKYSGVP